MGDVILFLRGVLLYTKRAGPPSSYTLKFFVLRDLEGTLAVLEFINNKPGPILNYVQLRGSRVIEVHEGEQDGFYPFVIEGGDGRSLFLAGRSPQERGAWSFALREAIAIAPDIPEEERNKEIDRLLTQEKKQKSKQPELLLLLLGPGESGKSTVVKQIKILTCNGFTPQEIEFYKHLCRKNIVEHMKSLLEINQLLGTALSDGTQNAASRLIQWFDTAKDVDVTKFVLPSDAVADVKALWADPVLRENTMTRSGAFNIGVSAGYFFNAIERITSDDYVPTTEDILRSRYRTTSVYETQFTVNATKFRIIDVGGQRGERKKWVNLFTDVTAIIFVAAISEYDQKLVEDNDTNRLRESLDVFGSICALKVLRKTSIILMLNKVDLFEEKITRLPLTNCFEEYAGNSVDDAKAYILDEFYKLKKSSARTIYSHFTCATDTKSFKRVLTAVTDIIISSLLSDQF